MKKLLLSMAAIAATMTVNAGIVTFDFLTDSYGLPEFNSENSNSTQYVSIPETITSGDVEILLSGLDTSKNCWRMWSDGLRAYNGGTATFTVSTTNGENVTGVGIEGVSGATFAVEGSSNNSTAWAGSEKEVTFVYTNTSANKAVVSITVTYGEDSLEVPDNGGNDDDNTGNNGGNNGGNTGGSTLQGDSVTFNFADPTSLYGVFDGDPMTFTGEEVEYNVTNVTFVSGVISITGTASEDATNVPRLFLGTGANPAWTYRFYKDNTVTIAAGEGYQINGIQFKATNLGNSSIEFKGEGTFSSNVWTAAEGACVSEVVITKNDTGNNPTISTMTVYFEESSEDSTGIEVLGNENAPIEYYNLQGVRVNNPSSGLYIIRQGNKTVKALIR